MEWRKKQEGLGAESGRQQHRMAKNCRGQGPPLAVVPKKKKKNGFPMP
jgi:hypothetical protein